MRFDRAVRLKQEWDVERRTQPEEHACVKRERTARAVLPLIADAIIRTGCNHKVYNLAREAAGPI